MEKDTEREPDKDAPDDLRREIHELVVESHELIMRNQSQSGGAQPDHHQAARKAGVAIGDPARRKNLLQGA